MRRTLAILWALPNSALGLPLALLALAGGGGWRWNAGILEAWGGWLGAVMLGWPGRSLQIEAAALGHVILAADRAALEAWREHERVHVRQAERWGALFLPAYFVGALWACGRGGRAYRDNSFEREAYAVAVAGTLVQRTEGRQRLATCFTSTFQISLRPPRVRSRQVARIGAPGSQRL